MSDPLSGDTASVGGAAESSGERSDIGPSRGRDRRRVLAWAGLALVAVVVVLIVTDPFGGSAKSGGGVGDNGTATSLATVTRRSLASQTQVSGTLGYAGSSSIRVPSGTAPSACHRRSSRLTNVEGMLSTARVSLAADSEALADQQATVSAARAKEAVDCAGEGAAESASSGSPSGGGGSGLCASDVQAVSGAEQSSSAAAMKVNGDRAQVSSAEKSLAGAEASLATARSSAAVYGQSSTFTELPSVGQILTRGESLFEINGQSVVLLYGPVLPTRAFIAGMSAGSDVAELNANLGALGYGQGLKGENSPPPPPPRSARFSPPTG